MAENDTNLGAASSGGDETPQAKRGKGKRDAAPEVTQGEPTQPRAVDPDTGLELDEHGLPLSGPMRARWLAEKDITDPALNASAEETENANG